MKPTLTADEQAERDAIRSAYRAKKGHGPAINSLGLGYRAGDTCACLVCDFSADDNSATLSMPNCPRSRSGAHTMRFVTRGRVWESDLKPELLVVATTSAVAS